MLVRLGLVFLILVFLCSFLSVLDRPNGSYPRLASYYLYAFPSSQNETLVPALARYDVVVLDMEMARNNPTAISGIRALNPNVIILAYLACQEVSEFPPSPSDSLRIILYNGIQPEWYLRDADGEHSVFWIDENGTRNFMLNCTDFCPEIGGQTWNTYFSNFITTYVLSNPLWNGYFVDNCWSVVPWIDMEIDCDSNSVADPRPFLDLHWQAGMQTMLSSLRSQNPSKILVGNTGYEYGQYLNGAMMEGWDVANPSFEFGYDWRRFMEIYSGLETEFQLPNYNMIYPMSMGGQFSNLQHMRFLLTTSLMGSAYYGIDLGPRDHSDTWWYDEYNSNLGLPLSPFVNAFSVSETNLLHNGTLDNNLAEWQIGFVTPSNGYVSSVDNGGNPYAECHITSTDGVYYKAQFMQINNPDIVFHAGENYVVSFRAKADHSRLIQMMLEQSDYDWAMTSTFDANLTTEWQTFSKIIFCPTDSIYATGLRFTFYMGQETGTVCIDDVSMRHLVYHNVMQREFENGLVLCNPSQTEVQTVNLNGTHYHLQGTQDSSINNGQACTSVTLQPQDGVILLNAPVSNSDQTIIPVLSNIHNYPNPFNMTTLIKFKMSQAQVVKLDVFNIRGQKVNTIIDEYRTSGEHSVAFTGLDKQGKQLASGIYFYKLCAGGVTKVNKMVIMR